LLTRILIIHILHPGFSKYSSIGESMEKLMLLYNTTCLHCSVIKACMKTNSHHPIAAQSQVFGVLDSRSGVRKQSLACTCPSLPPNPQPLEHDGSLRAERRDVGYEDEYD
jgi:hypothetical protein